MATVLEQYLLKQADFQSQITANNLPMNDLMLLQELNYRICVLETVQSLCKTAPISTDLKVISWHYQMLFTYISIIQKERKFGPKLDEEGQKKRDTALSSLETVIHDGKRRFNNFSMPTQDHYKKCISSFCNTVLPMWMQYRNTYIKI